MATEVRALESKAVFGSPENASPESAFLGSGYSVVFGFIRKVPNREFGFQISLKLRNSTSFSEKRKLFSMESSFCWNRVSMESKIP
ncbi:hypothetical protein ACHQM5_003900 [Ranunculus cassubicifolius]